MYDQWCKELKFMADRIAVMRKQLRDGLTEKGTPSPTGWDHITTQIGMFSFTGLTPSQCEKLIEKYSIYLLKTGRISLAGLTSKNINYVIEAFDDVCRNA